MRDILESTNEEKVRVLIIGATGLIGSEIRKELKKDKGCEVYGTSHNIEDDFYCDLFKPTDINFEMFSIVVICASLTNIGFCEENKKLCHKINYLGTVKLIENAVNKKCFVVFLSSPSVFNGNKSFARFNDTKSPINYYGLCKSLVEDWVTKNCKHNVAILRLTKVIPQHEPPPFVLKWIQETEKNGFSYVYSNHFVSPINVVSAVDAIKEVIVSKKGGIFQKGDDKELSYYEYAKIEFRQNPVVLQKLRVIEKGDITVFNSLETYLPKNA